MFRMLWKHQKRYLLDGQSVVWEFGVGPDAADYPDYVRGFNTLFERGFVFQGEKGLVFLNKQGMEYCRIHEKALGMNDEAWTQFVSARS